LLEKWKHLAGAGFAFGLLVGGLAPAGAETPRAGTKPRAAAAPFVEHALQAQLDRDPIWLRLLQIDPGLLSLRRSSSATSPAFFLADANGWSARRELIATLEAFFDDEAVLPDGEHPQCAFIARRHWLRAKLAIPREAMPERSCEHYDVWRQGLAATGMTLVYPEGFMNNPASMFGHTILRIDIDAESKGDEILGYAVDFTGDAGGDSGLVFIAKGIAGVYPGRFGVQPYYRQLRRYAEWEHRDIWEYPLELSDEELDFMLMHLWELRGVVHPYFFFTENCSYHLYRLLELAKPELIERDSMATFVIPIDTVRSVLAVPGLVGEPRYRPSPAKRLTHELEAMSPEQRRLSEAVASGQRAADDPAIAKLAAADRARVLDVAYERLRYDFVTGQRDQRQSQRLSRQILLARSRIRGVAKAQGDDVPVPAIRPDQGHESASASVAGGYRYDRPYIDLQYRPAFHTLLDREGGYPKNMQIRFFDTRLRIFPEQEKVRLQELTLVEALSLSARSEIFRSVAWNFTTGLATRRVSARGGLKDAAVARTDLGAGLAAEPWGGLHLYALATASLDAGPELEDDVSAGPGARAGVYLTWPGDRAKSHVFAEYRAFLLGDVSQQVRAGLEQRLTLTRNTALVAEGSYHRDEGEGDWLGALSFQLKF